MKLKDEPHALWSIYVSVLYKNYCRYMYALLGSEAVQRCIEHHGGFLTLPTSLTF